MFLMIVLISCSSYGKNKKFADCDYVCGKYSRDAYLKSRNLCFHHCSQYRGNVIDYNRCIGNCYDLSLKGSADLYDMCMEYCKNNFHAYNKEFPWLTPKLFRLYTKRSIQYKVPLKLALSLIQYESGGRNVVSRKNRNGTRDWGRMQINSVHMPKNPQKLLNDWTNSKIGFWYLGRALKKSRGNMYTAVRLYNQGLAGKHWKYRNWGYVKRIIRKYRSV